MVQKHIAGIHYCVVMGLSHVFLGSSKNKRLSCIFYHPCRHSLPLLLTVVGHSSHSGPLYNPSVHDTKDKCRLAKSLQYRVNGPKKRESQRIEEQGHPQQFDTPESVDLKMTKSAAVAEKTEYHAM